MFADIPKLNFTKITDDMRMRSNCYVIENDCYINCWLGTNNDGRYVTLANSCSIDNSFRMYNDILKSLGLSFRLTKPLVEYIPTIDYSYFNVKPIDDFLLEHKERLVMICNCYAQSAQAENFDFTPIIEKLCSTFESITFIATNPTGLSLPNLVHTLDITKVNDGFDLNEISYLSKYIDIYIGRSSGAQIFTMTKENCMDEKKIFVSFTYRPESAHIVNRVPKINAKILWSHSTNEQIVYDIICEVMNRRVYG